MAAEAFSAAIAHADMMLERCDQNYDALNARGLALAGLAVLQGGPRAAEAIAAFLAARAITKAPGIVGRVRRLLAALAPVDAAGVLAPVYKAAEGRDAAAGPAAAFRGSADRLKPGLLFGADLMTEISPPESSRGDLEHRIVLASRGGGRFGLLQRFPRADDPQAI